jgi:uncharacterized protein (TIGR03118 family)
MNHARWRPVALAAGACLTLSVALPATAADAQSGARSSAAAAASRYVQTNLVSDVPGMAQQTDPNLVNAWGASYLPGPPASPLWVSSNGKDVSTLYAGGVHGGAQAVVGLVVSIPGGAPTGQVSNTTTDFVVHDANGKSGSAKFIFVGETGHISGWNPAVGLTGTQTTSTQAEDAVTHPHAVYKGLAMGLAPNGPRLYAANFASGQVEVYRGNWTQLRDPHAFKDGSLPKGFSPFNVMVSGDRVYVAYAKSSGGVDEVDGPGLGRVDVFTLQGKLLQRAHATGVLNAPWGLAIAPAGFGSLSGDLLVGNFGDGRIHAYDPNSLASRGTLRGDNGRPVAIDGLWALIPGSGTEGGTDEVVFTAGPGGEEHGLLGTLSLAD